MKPFEKGRSGNPSGRPSEKPITRAYDKLLSMSRTELATYEPETGAEKIALAMIQKAWSLISPSAVAATKEVTDRVEGTVAQHIRVGPLALEDLTDDELEQRIRELQGK